MFYSAVVILKGQCHEMVIWDKAMEYWESSGWFSVLLDSHAVTTKRRVLLCFKWNIKKGEMKTAFFRSQKYYPYRIFSLAYSIQDISMLIIFRFCRDWEFRAMKIQALIYRCATLRAVSYRRPIFKRKKSVSEPYFRPTRYFTRHGLITYYHLYKVSL
jgi:hypothetical protein